MASDRRYRILLAPDKGIGVGPFRLHGRQGGSLKAQAVVEAYLKHLTLVYTGGEMPTVYHLRRAEYLVEPIPLGMATELVTAYHYAHGTANTAIFRHGLFHVDDPLSCLGAALWMPATKPSAVSVAGDDWRRVVCLSRLVIQPDMPTNSASFLLGKSIRLIRKDGRFHTLVTYADEGQGHTGAIYRATNWEYVGRMPGHPSYTDESGRMVATRAGSVTRRHAEMLALGYTRGPVTAKHKFVMRLGA